MSLIDTTQFVEEKEKEISHLFKNYHMIRYENQKKVIKAMQNNRLASTDFNWNTGYGYGDRGREKVEEIYAEVFRAEDALVRPMIVSGTHAINLALRALLEAGDELLYISGEPYDTLLKIIGINSNEVGTFKDHNINYNQVDLVENEFDYDGIKKAIKSNTKVIAIQRSTGYGNRNSLNIKQIKDVIDYIKSFTDIPIFVDNCYGEFTEYYEPIEVGADIIAGSLIKNPGGGVALSGGYVVGHADLIKKVSARLTAPGLNKDLGLTFGMSRSIMQGFYLAPHVVCEALKTATLLGACFKSLGFKIIPDIDDKRSDIVQTITFNDPKPMVEFCQSIQMSSAVDSYVIPMAWDMPGYEQEVIMASGSFVEGSSIEISADGPMRPPYNVYFQGSLTYDHGKLAIIETIQRMKEKGMVSL